MVKKKNSSKKQFLPLLEFFKGRSENFKRIYLAILFRTSILKRSAKPEYRDSFQGDYLKLINLLADPTPLFQNIHTVKPSVWHIPLETMLPDPNLQSIHKSLFKEDSLPLPFNQITHIKLIQMLLPQIGSISMNGLFKDINNLTIAAGKKDEHKRGDVLVHFIKAIWTSNFFEMNPDQHFILRMLQKVGNKLNISQTFQKASQSTTINEYTNEIRPIFTELNLRIDQKLKKIKSQSYQIRETFEEIHTDIKKIFELYALFIGEILALSDIVEDTFENSIENYFNKSKDVVFGIIGYGKFEHNYRRNQTSLIDRLKPYQTLLKFLKEIIFDHIRPIRNCECHYSCITRQERLKEGVYDLKNTRENYTNSFSLEQFWILRTHLYTILTLCFNLPFYKIHPNNITSFIMGNLDFTKYNPEYNLS